MLIMRLFKTSQIKELDELTIKNEPISSLELMERASNRITDWLLQFFNAHLSLTIFAGPGNNGGDALAVARLLSICGYNIEVYLINPNKNLSEDCEANKSRLIKQNKVRLIEVNTLQQLPVLDSTDWLIDGIFGSGLNRPLVGFFAQVIEYINESQANVIAIDIPSGLFGEDNSSNNPETIIRATHTLSLEFPKLAFLLPENECFVGKWHIIDINLLEEAKSNIKSPFYFTDKDDINHLLKPRKTFSHKGTFGHALFIGGSLGKIGATVLASKACLRTGVGLLSVVTPYCGLNILQTCVPEAMCIPNKESDFINEYPEKLNEFSAIGIGCGLGLRTETAVALKKILKKSTKPLILDADALNILSMHPEWIQLIPEQSVITPHPKEFERLVGQSENRWEQISKAITFSKKLNIYIVLKGAYTTIICPDGEIYFNSTGNPGMATAGSGDVLSGIILSLLAQSYSPKAASIIGVYFHGLAGDIAAKEKGESALIASDIIENIKLELE